MCLGPHPLSVCTFLNPQNCHRFDKTGVNVQPNFKCRPRKELKSTTCFIYVVIFETTLECRNCPLIYLSLANPYFTEPSLNLDCLVRFESRFAGCLFIYLFFFTSHDSKTFHFWGDHELLLGTLLTGLRQMMTQMAQPVVIISRSPFDNVWRKRCGWKERWRGANGDNETSLSIGIESFHYCAVGHAYCGRCRYTPWNGGRVFFFFILSSRAVLDACRPCDHWLTIFLLSGITLLRENIFFFFEPNAVVKIEGGCRWNACQSSVGRHRGERLFVLWYRSEIHASVDRQRESDDWWCVQCFLSVASAIVWLFLFFFFFPLNFDDLWLPFWNASF